MNSCAMCQVTGYRLRTLVGWLGSDFSHACTGEDICEYCADVRRADYGDIWEMDALTLNDLD